MHAILALIPVVQSALAVFSAFKGDEKAAKLNTAVNDAATLIEAAAPLFEQFASGKKVTPEQVRDALDGFDSELDAFDKELAAREKAAGH